MTSHVNFNSLNFKKGFEKVNGHTAYSKTSNWSLVWLKMAEKPIFAIIDTMSLQHLGLTTQFPSQGMG